MRARTGAYTGGPDSDTSPKTVHQQGGRAFAQEPVADACPVDLELRDCTGSVSQPTVPVSLAQPRYRLSMARRTVANTSDTISRLADSDGKAILNLVTLPLRMFIGALDILETQVHKAADGLRDIDPLDERVVELERRMALLEQQPAGRRQDSRTTTAPKQTTPTAMSHESEQAEPSTSHHQEAPGQTLPRTTA